MHHTFVNNSCLTIDEHSKSMHHFRMLIPGLPICFIHATFGCCNYLDAFPARQCLYPYLSTSHYRNWVIPYFNLLFIRPLFIFFLKFFSYQPLNHNCFMNCCCNIIFFELKADDEFYSTTVWMTKTYEKQFSNILSIRTVSVSQTRILLQALRKLFRIKSMVQSVQFMD